ncbi:MAG: tRNA A-37 threonylcarbamoyl transferase component Bud32 [Gammaproteobacteria bacterium]|jgi:tRNA A-37 threonylcarbamoyl transferase component Bud32
MLGSILFNRALKQFLECPDVDSEKGLALTAKIRNGAHGSLEKIVEVIPSANIVHQKVLKQICIEHAEGSTQEMFLSQLENDETNIRHTAADILSQSIRLSPAKLFKQLHESEISKTEIIGILESRKSTLKPEQLINNAVKMEKTYAEKLIIMAGQTDSELDLSALSIKPESIASPSIKIYLLRYFGAVEQADVSEVIGKFLSDSNKAVVIEALKALKSLSASYDASILLPVIVTMSETEREIAMAIIHKQADAALVGKLAGWTTGKSDELREIFIKLVIQYADEINLGKFLKRLDQQEWWGKEQALKCLQRLADDRFCRVAAKLAENSQEFVRSTAQQLMAQGGDPEDIDQLKQLALHEDWQVREKAILSLGSSANREALDCLAQVIQQWPESALAVLKSVQKLGFSKGLETAFLCLKMPEALVQRGALETIGKLAIARYAKNIRDKVMQQVPKLQPTVRDTAGDVVYTLTEKFNLEQLDVNIEEFFETRLMKIDDVQSQAAVVKDTSQEQAQLIKFQNIEELKEGDLWMDRFRIRQEIGRGAMGRVMLAEDEIVGEELILKFMHPELTADGASRERFLREVKYSRKISHPNVIRIHDMLFKDNLCAISMEYFVSRGVDELLKEKGFFEVEEGLDVLRQVSEGMSVAHKQEVVHRDLKPSNILMNDEGHVKVVDFGIASASSNSDATLTKTGLIIGTPAYLSPERARGYEAEDRCDIYALGIIAYYLFSGSLPYRGEPMSMLFQHLEGKAKPVHEIKPSVSPRIGMLVKKMMAVEAENRVQTMDEVHDTIVKIRKNL